MPVTLTQTVAGAAQFDAASETTGLFLFRKFWRLPRTTGVVIHSLSYVELDAGPALTTEVAFYSRRSISGAPTIKVPLGDATAAAGLLDVNGDARLKLCGHVLEREPGAFVSVASIDALFWDVTVETRGKTETATVTLTYDLCDFQESELRGAIA